MRLQRTASIAFALATTSVLAAQQPAFKRTILQQVDISVPGREVVTAAVDFEPGASPGRHTHPGEEVGYVIEGTISLERAGQPAAVLNAGQSFVIPAGTVHNATATTKARLVATYIVEKGKPLATPAAPR
jgi:quercetin dioxygenase-like cupin family protein